MKNKNNSNKKKRKLIIIYILVGLVLVIGLTYAWFRFSKLSDHTNSITTGKAELKLDEYDGKTIDLSDTIPMSDSSGINTKAYEFDIINKHDKGFKYQVKLLLDEEEIEKDNCSDKILDDSVIRYQLIRNSSFITIDNLSNTEDWILDTSSLPANKTAKYKLRLWIDENAGNEHMNKHFHGKIEVNLVEEA